MRSTIAAIIVILTCLRKAQRLRLYFKMGSSRRRLVQENPQQTTEEQQRRQKITNPQKQVTFEAFGDQVDTSNARSLSFLLEVEVVGEAFNLRRLKWNSAKHMIPITFRDSSKSSYISVHIYITIYFFKNYILYRKR